MEGASASPPLRSPPQKRSRKRTIIIWLIAIFILAVLLDGILLGPITPSLRKARESAAMQTSRTIALAMFQYANDHDGKYPTGRSSTEVFQQLIDENYVIDPKLFYIQMAGKSAPTSNTLKPENVSYDVTTPVDSNSPKGLPLVFLTGYRIEYKAGGSAIPLANFVNPFGNDGLAVCYSGNNAWFKVPMSEQASDGGVVNFVAPDFDAHGQKFQQLTPDGPLPPAK
jgi:type II secretory pathway pseudopilin PulG